MEELLVVDVAVTVAITIAVTVAVVAVSAADVLRAVEDDCHVLVGVLLIEYVDFLQEAAVHDAGADDEEADIDIFLQDNRVGDDVDGRTVNDDVVILVLHLFHQFAHFVVEEKLCRVGRYDADGHDVHSDAEGILLDERVRVVVESGEVVADADFRFTDDAGERAVAQVEVDGEHFFVLQSDDFGKVGCDEALSGAGVEGGQHDDLAAVVEAVDKVVEFGSQDAEGFVDEVA